MNTINPDLAAQWHPTKNGDLAPTDVAGTSNKKVWWLCPKGHEWEANINSRSQGRGCPYCSGKWVLAGFNDLATINPKLSEEWNYTKNGSLQPTMVTKGSNRKVWWICPHGHEWEAVIGDRSSGRGCPVCGKESAREKLGRKILCVDTGQVFKSSTDAAKSCNGFPSNIINCCQGKIKSAYGYRWQYYDETK